MGANTQTYLIGMFANMRAKMIASGQKVEPVAPAAQIKSAQFERNYCPDVVLTLSEQKTTKETA